MSFHKIMGFNGKPIRGSQNGHKRKRNQIKCIMIEAVNEMRGNKDSKKEGESTKSYSCFFNI